MLAISSNVSFRLELTDAGSVARSTFFAFQSHRFRLLAQKMRRTGWAKLSASYEMNELGKVGRDECNYVTPAKRR